MANLVQCWRYWWSYKIEIELVVIALAKAKEVVGRVWWSDDVLIVVEELGIFDIESTANKAKFLE